jgi:hypothetical protein
MAGALWPAARLSRTLLQISDMDAFSINRVMLFPTPNLVRAANDGWGHQHAFLRPTRNARCPFS